MRWSIHTLAWGLMMGFAAGGGAAAQAGDAPRVFILEGEVLVQVRQRIEAGDARYTAAIEALRNEADAALERGPYSVTDKTGTPPSGNKHDYMSIGPYWWPNPDTDDGLPYIRRDGEENPERRDGTYDNIRLHAMSRDVQRLALAYHFTGHEPYAEHAATLLRTWFLDPQTRMNPHLEYAQAIPGRTAGRGIGIIDTAGWAFLIDAVGMIQRCRHWSDGDQRGLEAWFAQYIDWLKQSDHGQAEQRHPNNHGTWYDAQIVAYMLFCDQRHAAREQLLQWTRNRIAEHFEPDGRQPAEFTRTRPWHYGNYNLSAHITAARLGRHAEVDLWGHETDDGRSIRVGIDYLLQYVGRIEDWPHPEPIHAPDPARLAQHVLPAAVRNYDGERYREAFKRLGPEAFERDRIRLTHPYLFEKNSWQTP